MVWDDIYISVKYISSKHRVSNLFLLSMLRCEVDLVVPIVIKYSIRPTYFFAEKTLVGLMEYLFLHKNNLQSLL